MKIAILLSFCSIVERSTANNAFTFGILVTVVVPSRLLVDGYVVESQESSEELTISTTAKTKNMTLEEHIANLRKFYLECTEETRVKPDLVRKLRSGNWRVDHPALKKWALCVLNKLDLMSLQGVLRYDTAMSRIHKDDEEIVDNIIKRCLRTKAKAGHEIAWSYLKCLRSRDKKQRFLSLGIFYKLPDRS